ncbi:MAG TPA: glycine zipper domain-containing protein [Shinella sp.]|jgi:NhaP-type Na+/H+ or K+/H+ antiporter|uniref:YMGG-like glycine zipper-containing protein n=1 Tax=Shinella sp. TaxID=1870904 RepID=UPI0029A5503F|nr:glycine zipper domain-containing protein [Shinella sp.]MDX3975996.1 glycine zipper domain-containing protein [Shinella sp.]HEV7245936.1 glycine zipper domain-containing protein [Shinella sp.]
MKKTIIALALVASTVTLTACTQTERGTAIGAGTGAIIGGVVTGRAGGALAGAAIGGVAGYLVSRSDRNGYCIYRDRYGRRYEARCR